MQTADLGFGKVNPERFSGIKEGLPGCGRLVGRRTFVE
jgi:hypothetical protein